MEMQTLKGIEKALTEAYLPANHTFADLHHTYWDARKGKNDQVRFTASSDGKTFMILKGREGVRVGKDKPRAYGPYDIADFDKEYERLIRQGFLCTFDKAPEELKLKEESSYAPMSDPTVDDIVNGLVQCSRQAFEEMYSVSVKRIADIPKTNIDTARQILRAMDNEKDTLSEREFNHGLMLVYEILPRRIDNLQKMIARSRNDFSAILLREADGINMLESQIQQAQIKKAVATHKPNICEAYGFEIRPVTPEEKDEILEHLVGNDNGDPYDCRGNYRFGMRIIYDDDNPINTRYEGYCNGHGIGTDDYEHGQSLLFHGSGTENYWNIVKVGWMTNPDADICGKAYGNGIYFAPSAMKSINYASNSSMWRAADNSKAAFLSMADVATGILYDVENAGPGGSRGEIPRVASDLERICPGADCLWAYGGNRFRHDEVIVYRECQARAKYLIEVA